MTLKYLEDCAACPMVSHCDAHVSGGTWHHREGVNPCDVVIKNRDLVVEDYKKIQDTAMEDYKIICDMAWVDYKIICDPAWEDYMKIQGMAWDNYKIICDPAWEDYKKIRDGDKP